MLPQIDPNIPVVGVCNISETFYEFLQRAEDDTIRQHLIHGEQYRGDRALIWFGDPKLVFVTFPVPHAAYLCQQLGYIATECVSPEQPSPWLSLDILRERRLLERLVSYAGAERQIQLIPYATTPQFLQLVAVLRSDYNLTVLLPETPDPEAVWLRDYVDTKTGFRMLASRWLSNAETLLPEGFACHPLTQAAKAVRWFHGRGQSCLVKADIGENGTGNLVMRPDDITDLDAIADHLSANDFLADDRVVVEEMIAADRVLSPSLEVFVPHAHLGEPYVTYLSDQVFQDFGDFCGVLLSRELEQTPWYPPFRDAGLLLARKLQAMGYVGNFDMDAIVDDQNRIYLLEINSRRTGGTHVHDFAHFFFGDNYLDRVALLTNDTMKSGDITDADELIAAVGDMAYPVNGEERGVIVTITSALRDREFGCIIVGKNKDDVMTQQADLVERLRQVNATRSSR